MITAMPRIAIAVDDFARAVTTFRDGFGMPVFDFSDTTVPELGAHVGMCQPVGGSNIELMSPANPEQALSQALQKFLDHRGQGLYALMLEAPDPNAEAAELLQRGVKVLPLMPGAGGRDIHPSATHGVLIRIYPNNSVSDKGGREIADPAISGIVRVIVATTDAVKAADVYRTGLGLDVAAPIADEARGVLTATCRPPKGGIIELVSVIDSTAPFAAHVARFLERKGEGMFALVLQADDPPAAARLLSGRGVSVDADVGRASIGVTSVSAFGTRLLIDKPSGGGNG